MVYTADLSPAVLGHAGSSPVTDTFEYVILEDYYLQGYLNVISIDTVEDGPSLMFLRICIQLHVKPKDIILYNDKIDLINGINTMNHEFSSRGIIR